jgi:hypothetical protein
LFVSNQELPVSHVWHILTKALQSQVALFRRGQPLDIHLVMYDFFASKTEGKKTLPKNED